MEETCFLAVMELWERVDVMHLSKRKKKHFIRMNELTGDDSEIAKWKYEMVQTSCMFYLFKQQRWELQIYFGSVWMG